MNDAFESCASLDDLVADVVDQFMERVRRGEQPSIEDYTDRHPEAAELLRQILPALQVLQPPSEEAGASVPDAQGGTLGDFRILREVGRGGMGIVYEAEQISLGRRVALKVLPFAATLDPRQLQRFHNEARAAASLHHEHIVPVFAVGQERGVHYFAMQFIEGRTLADLITQERRIVVARFRFADRRSRRRHRGDRRQDDHAAAAGARLLPPGRRVGHPGRRGPRTRPRLRHRPSRHQAGQPDD